MTELDSQKRRLRDEVLAMIAFDAMSSDELRQAVLNFQEAVEADIPPQELETLVRQPPQAPRSFFEKWADRFADWAVESYSSERLEVMNAGGSKGRMLILADFFEFAEESSVELRRDLVALARADGVSPQAVLLLLQAVATWREGRPDRRQA